MAEEIRACSTKEVPPGTIKKVVLQGREIALCNSGGTVYAVSSICPHQGGPLDEGELDGDTLICPLHGWMFNVKDGSAVLNPRIKIRTYPVRISGEDILVSVS